MSGVFAAGLILLAAAAAVDLGAGARWPRLMSVPYLLGAAGSGCLAAAGAGVLAGGQAPAGRRWLARVGPAEHANAGPGRRPAVRPVPADLVRGRHRRVPGLRELGGPPGCAGPGPPRAGGPGRTLVGRRGLGASYALTLGAVAVIMTATDAFTAAVRVGDADGRVLPARGLRTGAARPPRKAPSSPWSSAGSAGRRCSLGLLLLAARSHSLSLASFTHVSGGASRDAAEALLFAGFAIKVGLVPFQVWMPRGYPAAPGPGPGDHGRSGGQRRVLRPVAQPQPVRRGPGLADRPDPGPGRDDRAAGHRARCGSAEPAAGHRLLQRGECRADPGRVRGRTRRCGPPSTRGWLRPGCSPRPCRSWRTRPPNRSCSPAVAMIESESGTQRSGRAVRHSPTATVERDRTGHRLADARRAAANRRLRV